jgi:hypothetical protein
MRYESDISTELPRSVPDRDERWPCASGQHKDCIGVVDNAIEEAHAECSCLCHRRSVLTNYGDTNSF